VVIPEQSVVGRCPVVPSTTNKFETCWKLCPIVTILDGGFETRVGLATETFAPLCQVFTKMFPYFTHKRRPHLRRLRRIPVNKDQVSGRVEQAVGKVKQSVGETFGNETLDGMRRSIPDHGWR
jgi:hypothetical protein